MAKTPLTPVKAARRLSGSSKVSRDDVGAELGQGARRIGVGAACQRPDWGVRAQKCTDGRPALEAGRTDHRDRSPRRRAEGCHRSSFLHCRRIASRFSRCSLLTEDLPSVGIRPAAPQAGLAHVNPLLKISCRAAGHCQGCRKAGEEASPDHGDSRDRRIGFGATAAVLGERHGLLQQGRSGRSAGRAPRHRSGGVHDANRHLPKGGVGDLVGAVSTCVSVTTRSGRATSSTRHCTTSAVARTRASWREGGTACVSNADRRTACLDC